MRVMISTINRASLGWHDRMSAVDSCSSRSHVSAQSTASIVEYNDRAQIDSTRAHP